MLGLLRPIVISSRRTNVRARMAFTHAWSGGRTMAASPTSATAGPLPRARL